jgi:UDP-glucose 4-epimerase
VNSVSGQHVVVTGGAGFIGSHVVDELLRRDARVFVIDDFSVGEHENLVQHVRDERLEVCEGDIRDHELLEHVFAGADIVLHLAVANVRKSFTHPHLVHEVNATGTLGACRAALAANVKRFLYVSSSEAYGSAVSVPMSEDHPLHPTTVYGASKAAGALYTLAHHRSYGADFAVVCPFNTYGPREHSEGDSGEVIPRFVMRALAGVSPVVFGDGQQTRDFTWVGDTARGIVDAATAPGLAGQQVNVARGEEVTIARIAELVLEATGRTDLGIEYRADRPGDVRRHYADVQRAAQLLGDSTRVPIAEGIRRYVDWVIAQQVDVDAWLRSHSVVNW